MSRQALSISERFSSTIKRSISSWDCGTQEKRTDRVEGGGGEGERVRRGRGEGGKGEEKEEEEWEEEWEEEKEEEEEEEEKEEVRGRKTKEASLKGGGAACMLKQEV